MAVESAINEARSLSYRAVVWTALLVFGWFLAKRHFVFALSDGSQKGHSNRKMATAKFVVRASVLYHTSKTPASETQKAKRTRTKPRAEASKQRQTS